MHMYMYIYIYIYICIYIYIYIYTYNDIIGEARHRQPVPHPADDLQPRHPTTCMGNVLGWLRLGWLKTH